ncbi:hypothetical protein FACS1894105_03130 [Clostridia bacterium]|nr:hypothetical protein FACS1894105_03130 [Clostridia bacterium]
MHFNPFVYIRSEKDILKFTTALIANTKGEDAKSGDDFWQSATRSHTNAIPRSNSPWANRPYGAKNEGLPTL